MLLLTPGEAGLAAATSLAVSIAGAESNVAANIVALGRSATWVSRVGDDALGERVVAELTARGIEVSVEVDTRAPTGLMLKDPGSAGTRIQYYRQNSAASLMDAGFVPSGLLQQTRVVHVSGVTPALSRSCGRMVDQLFIDARVAGALVSFDVNDRRQLWPVGEAAETLGRLANAANICFVGRDEAELLWNTSTAHEIRRHLPTVELLVVKDADIGATAFRKGEAPVFVPAPPVDVVEPVGAGDAFAAGFLAAMLKGGELQGCLSLGHAAAGHVLLIQGDLIPIGADA